MKVSAFRVGNFKAFAAGQRASLRPITLATVPTVCELSLIHALGGIVWGQRFGAGVQG